MSPTQRALQILRREGWTVVGGEYRTQFPDRNRPPCPACRRPHMVSYTKDLGGFCDILVVRGAETLAVQVTSSNGGNVSARRTKVAAEPRARECVKAWGVEVWGIDTRRAEAGPCKVCDGNGSTLYVEMGGDCLKPDRRRCPACKGTGRGKRPLRKVVHCQRWRMQADGTWLEIKS